jgi:pimeloyl-ACP methyl ester carboxylesterase
VFVHGAGGNALSWQNQRYGLDRGVNTVCLDLPGHGQSHGGGCSTVAEYAGWFFRFVQCLGLSRVTAAGHSMGGAVVLEATLQNPLLMEALVLIGTGARLRVSPALLDGLSRDFRGSAGDLIRLCYGPESSKELIAWGLEQFLAERPEVTLDDFKACDAFDRLGLLSGITQPALVLCGDEDTMTPLKYSQYLSDHLSHATLTIIQGAGHMVAVEKPSRVNRAIERFLAAL